MSECTCVCDTFEDLSGRLVTNRGRSNKGEMPRPISTADLIPVNCSNQNQLVGGPDRTSITENKLPRQQCTCKYWKGTP